MSPRAPIAALLCAALLSLVATPAQAALTWTQTEASSATKPLQRTLEIPFAFKNTGRTPVGIVDVQVSCDCMSAAADKKLYQPGESGLIHARFTVGDRTGTYERAVVVVTDDNAPPQRLRVHIEVPELASVEPRLIDWAVGAAPDERSVTVVVAPDIRISFTELFVSSPAFAARFETAEVGRRYRLFIKPVATGEAASAAIRLKGKAENGDDVVVSAYANVR